MAASTDGEGWQNARARAGGGRTSGAMSAADRAEELHQEALALDDGGETDAALARYLGALALDGARSSTHYNVGLINKCRGRRH
jgi:Flp pilus assembly protein TadD